MINNIQHNIPTKKSPQEMKFYLSAGRRFGEILRQLRNIVKTSVDMRQMTAKKIISAYNKLCYEEFYPEYCDFPFNDVKHGDGYVRYDRPICISVNDVVAHGIWRGRKESGNVVTDTDVISVDCGITMRNPDTWHVLNLDAAFTVASDPWTAEPLVALIEILDGNPRDTHEISEIVRDIAQIMELHQVVALAGHGIGNKLHEPPKIYNMPGNFSPVQLFDGMCFCPEPIYVLPKEYNKLNPITQVYVDSDGWSVKTVTGEKASHWETTFGVIDGQIVDLIGITEWDI